MEKVSRAGLEGFCGQNLDAIRSESFSHYLIAIGGVEIDLIIYGCHLCIAKFFLSYPDAAWNQHICGEANTEIKIANRAQPGGRGEGAYRHNPVLLCDWKRLSNLTGVSGSEDKGHTILMDQFIVSFDSILQRCLDRLQ